MRPRSVLIRISFSLQFHSFISQRQITLHIRKFYKYIKIKDGIGVIHKHKIMKMYTGTIST